MSESKTSSNKKQIANTKDPDNDMMKFKAHQNQKARCKWISDLLSSILIYYTIYVIIKVCKCLFNNSKNYLSTRFLLFIYLYISEFLITEPAGIFI